MSLAAGGCRRLPAAAGNCRGFERLAYVHIRILYLRSAVHSAEQSQ